VFVGGGGGGKCFKPDFKNVIIWKLENV